MILSYDRSPPLRSVGTDRVAVGASLWTPDKLPVADGRPERTRTGYGQDWASRTKLCAASEVPLLAVTPGTLVMFVEWLWTQPGWRRFLAAELLAIAEDLRHHDIQLELLTGPLQGVYDPSGHGAALFAFFAGMAESEREYIREKSLEGQVSARERGRHGGRPKVIDDDQVHYARALRAAGLPVPQIARKLVISSGKNKGENPSVATVYRVLADDDTERNT